MRRNERTISADASSGNAMCEPDETTCSVCFAEFLDSEDLKVHIEQVHPSGKLLNCQFCHKTVSDAENYVLHIRDVHLLDLRGCWACSRVFTDSAQFRRHESRHPRSMREGYFLCSHCDQSFLLRSELEQHEMNSHYETEGAFLDKYYALLSSVINIKAETFIKSTGKDFVFVCSRCKYSSTDLEAYMLHLKKNNCRSLVCDWCCKLYNRKSRLAGHLIQHLKGKTELDQYKVPSKIKSKQCSKCKKYFDAKSMKDHSCKISFKCSHCDNEFETMYELSEHQPKAHPLAVALMLCKFCRKECVGTIALEKHIERAHNHELHLYKYTCSYCNITYKHPQRLFAHYFQKHKDINPYLCKICDKQFRVRKSFTLHIKLQHKSVGFVEFDEKLHVFFTDQKSEKPFQPVSKYVQEKPAGVGTNATKNKGKKGNEPHKKDLVSIDSDVNPTDTEANQTDTKNTRNRKRKQENLDEMVMLSDCDSDDEPLVVVKKKAKLKSQMRKRPLRWFLKSKKGSKTQFTCKICKQYCYTFQNYQNHVNMHFKDESKKCIKCSLSFKSKADLQRHMKEQHSSSRLTETLKNILERRKRGDQKQELSTAMKFRNTIKKVQIEKDDVTATITPTTKELSVQKFIENFTPEGTEVKTVQIQSNVSLTRVTAPVEKAPGIKMTKFIRPPEINEARIRLTMPVKFKKSNEQHSVTVKRVETEVVPNKIKFSYDIGNQFQDDDNDNDDYHEDIKDSNIPEVEQEVTLAAEEVPKRNPATHRIVIPKLPKELKSIRIAHLLPEAPFYKIVKVADIMKDQEKQQQPEEEQDVDADVRLPDGTKLVHVNPLAHLLGNTPVEQIMKPSKYYKPKPKNFEAVLAKALRKLDDPAHQNRKKKSSQGVKKAESIVNDKAESEALEDIETAEKEATVSEDKELTENREEITIDE